MTACDDRAAATPARDFGCCAPVGPDCRDQKHPACDGRALDEHTDGVTCCTCSCHGRVPVEVVQAGGTLWGGPGERP